MTGPAADTATANGTLGQGSADASAAPDRGLAEDLLRQFGLDGLRRLARGGREAVLTAIDREIAAIDDLLSAQVDAILHHPRFQQLEAAWRALDYLTERLEGTHRIKLRVLCASWAEVSRDIDRAPEFDQCELFRKIYSDEFDMPGGEPYGLLVADYFVEHRPQGRGASDVATLRGLSAIAAAAFAPCILGAAPGLLGLDSFRELTPTLDVAGRVQQREYNRWRSLQGEEDTRFMGIALPPVLLRAPYAELPRRDGFRYAEDVSDPDAGGYLWGNPAFAFASVVMRSFDESGWFGDIRGTRQGELTGGLVTDLPVADFGTDAPSVAYRSPLVTDIPDNQERSLSNLGLMPLTVSQYTPYLIFYSNQSLHRPKRYDSNIAETNAKIAAMLHYVLCISRFAHFIKVIGRDMVGSLVTPEDCESRLQNWLAEYTMAPTGGQSDPSLLAKYPLSEAEVQVREKPGKPGSYHCTMFLRPHYQLDELVSSFKLTTELAPGAAA